MCVKLLQSCLTLCDSKDRSLSSSSVHGIIQAINWSGLPCPPPGYLPNPGIKAVSLISAALAGRFFTTSTIWQVFTCMYYSLSSAVQGLAGENYIPVILSVSWLLWNCAERAEVTNKVTKILSWWHNSNSHCLSINSQK